MTNLSLVILLRFLRVLIIQLICRIPNQWLNFRLTQDMTLKWEGSEGNIYFALHGYRTDWGK